MKNLSLLSFVLISTITYGQFNSNAPWLQNQDGNTINKQVDQNTFKNQQKLFYKYWESNDKNEKGSGYKVFKRWEAFYENTLRPNGIIENSAYWMEILDQEKGKNSKMASVSNWNLVGPVTHVGTSTWSRGQGRVNTVTVDPNNPNTIYIGAPAGGIWKSTNGGSSWQPLSDKLPTIGVSGIAIDKNNSKIIYIATGDKDGGNTYSLGVLKSIDGGITWNKTGLSYGSNEYNQIGDIEIHSTNSQIILCATSRGVYRSINGGENWKLVSASEDFSGGTLRFKPNEPSTVYACSTNSFYKSTNGGESFTKITSGLPSSLTGRMILDVTPVNNKVVYVLTANTSKNFQGIYKSTDSGTTFAKTASTSDIFEHKQAFYNLALAVSSTNENEIFTGCLNLWKSVDGGNKMTKVNNWNNWASKTYTHADNHFLRYFGNKLYCGSDGGIFVSENNGALFTDKTAGLAISQFYRISVSKSSSNSIIGGTQDNGGFLFSNNTWNNHYGADGMDVAISQRDQNLSYGFIQNGDPLYISTNGRTYSTVVNAPSGLEGNWITPLKGNSKGEIFAGYNQLYKLTKNASGGQYFVRQNNDASSLSGVNINFIEIAPSNDNIMFIVQGSSLYKSTDSGVNLKLSYTSSSSISSCAIHYSNPQIVYITTSGSNGNVLKSTDGGVTFKAVGTGLPNISKNIVAHQGKNSNNPLYVGTSIGVYYIDDTLTSWVPFNTNLPNVPVRDIEINLNDNKITIATYGRGIWQTSIQSALSSNNFEFNNVTISPIPTNGILDINFDAVNINEIEVYDIMGKMIYEKRKIDSGLKNVQIDLGSVTDGVYFVKLFTENNSIVKKIVKN